MNVQPLAALGLDPAQAQDWSALALVQPREDLGCFFVTGLHRFPQGTSYPAQARETTRLVQELQQQGFATRVALDVTGVGTPVSDLFTEMKVPHLRVLITDGAHETMEKATHHVPKRDLIAGLLVAVQQGLLKVAPELELGRTLAEEMRNYRVHVNLKNGRESFIQWRESVHDDLMLATSLAVWAAKRGEIQGLLTYLRRRGEL